MAGLGGGRPLRLPSTSGSQYLKNIGYSFFIAFPSRPDRNQLIDILFKLGVYGMEPPVDAVLSRLMASRNCFSSDFKGALDDFNNFMAQGGRAECSPFWRVIHDEALGLVPVEGGPESGHNLTLMFVQVQDGLEPVVLGRAGASIPEGHSLDDPGDLPDEWLQLADGCGGWQTPGLSVFLPEPPPWLSLRISNMVAQGVLVLRRIDASWLEPVTGNHIQDCDIALVREDRLPAFQAAFSGSSSKACVDGWFELWNCKIRRQGESFRGLEDVLALQPTMPRPSVAIRGGIQVPGGHFLFPGMLPKLSARGADRVWLRGGGVNLQCAFEDVTGLWSLPGDLPAGDYECKAEWTSNSGAGDLTAGTRLHLDGWVLSDDYRPVGQSLAGYSVEASGGRQHRGELAVAAGHEVPFGILNSGMEPSDDLVRFDPSARYLGPGLGVMSLEPKTGI